MSIPVDVLKLSTLWSRTRYRPMPPIRNNDVLWLQIPWWRRGCVNCPASCHVPWRVLRHQTVFNHALRPRVASPPQTYTRWPEKFRKVIFTNTIFLMKSRKNIQNNGKIQQNKPKCKYTRGVRETITCYKISESEEFTKSTQINQISNST